MHLLDSRNYLGKEYVCIRELGLFFMFCEFTRLQNIGFVESSLICGLGCASFHRASHQNAKLCSGTRCRGRRSWFITVVYFGTAGFAGSSGGIMVSPGWRLFSVLWAYQVNPMSGMSRCCDALWWVISDTPKPVLKVHMGGSIVFDQSVCRCLIGREIPAPLTPRSAHGFRYDLRSVSGATSGNVNHVTLQSADICWLHIQPQCMLI